LLSIVSNSVSVYFIFYSVYLLIKTGGNQNFPIRI